MRLAILEFETHSHLIYLWEELLKDVKELDYKFFITPAIAQHISEIPLNKKQIIKIDNISENIHEFRSYDVVIFNTLHRNFDKFTSIFNHGNVLLLVHNSNFYFHSIAPQWKYLRKVKNINLIYYYLKIIFREKIYQTKEIINKAWGYGYLNTDVTFNNKGEGKHNFVIPLHYNSFFSLLKNTYEIRIVIPGNVSCNRRNYSLIFDLILRINPQEKLRFIFLGKPEGHRMIQKLEKLKKSILHPNVKIEYYTQRIPQDDFIKQMQQAHFVLCPILKETQFYLQPEIYGKTKASGNEGDCIYYGKIGIFPDYYKIQNWTCLYYKNKNNLCTILENLTYEKYIYYHQELSDKIEIFTKENSQKKLLNLIKNVKTA